MSAYDRDRRVIASLTGRSFSVDIDVFHRASVRLCDDDRWEASRALGEFSYHATADEAIRSLIGDPWP